MELVTGMNVTIVAIVQQPALIPKRDLCFPGKASGQYKWDLLIAFTKM
jgi:hypothetical protein